jgi:hypothetical protein
MSTLQNRLRALGAATIAVTLMSAPTLSIAQTNQQNRTPHVTKSYPKNHLSRQWHPQAGRNLYGSAQGRCAWPYQNLFPPCQSTFPEGSPNYHGGRPGPTFDNE